MNADVNSENAECIRRELASGRFESADDVVNAGIALLRRRQQVLATIDDGRRQLDAREFTEYTEDEMDAFLSELVGHSGSELEDAGIWSEEVVPCFESVAREQIIEIAEYIAERNPAASEQVLQALRATFAAIARTPAIGL